MLYYLVAGLLLLHTVFWGLGLSWLVLPRRWRAAWWIFAPVFGLALQSAVVWFGAQTAWSGTESYAWPSELLPLALLAWAVRREGRAGVRRRWADLRRAWPTALLLMAVGASLLWPMAQRGGWTLTSSSLGSCDHADYAAGARVFREFSSENREGFMGLPEVTRVGSAETFFAYWQRLNHFTPSALLAHQAALLRLEPYQLVSVNGVVLLLLNVPLVLLLARGVGLGAAARLAVAAVYGFSPLSAYAVHHGALGQLYAAHGIAVLTLAVIACARDRRESLRLGVVLFAALWLLAGSYNFILTVAFAPAAAWVLFDAVQRRSVRHWPRLIGWVAAAVAACVVIFWGRFAGFVERFQLFEQYDFGWPVPLLGPAAWLGAVAEVDLRGWTTMARVAAETLAVAAFAYGVLRLFRTSPRRVVLALALVAPVVAGWALLVAESATRANASYDAYKLISVFFPGLLAGMCAWAARCGRRSGGLGGRVVAVGLTVVVALNLWGAARAAAQMRLPPLRVEAPLVEVQRLESMPAVTAINLRVEDFWSRLWANQFLLRRPQYFLTHTYEARLNTPLRGEWDLSDSLLRAMPAAPADFVGLNGQFHAVRVGAPGFVRLGFGAGWHAAEGRLLDRWRWSRRAAELEIDNPATTAVTGTLRLRVRAIAANSLRLQAGAHDLGAREVGEAARELVWRGVVLPPGRSVLRWELLSPPVAVPGDGRELGVALSELIFAADPAPSL